MKKFGWMLLNTQVSRPSRPAEMLYHAPVSASVYFMIEDAGVNRFLKSTSPLCFKYCPHILS
jgi:hypothetical protein